MRTGGDWRRWWPSKRWPPARELKRARGPLEGASMMAVGGSPSPSRQADVVATRNPRQKASAPSRSYPTATQRWAAGSAGHPGRPGCPGSRPRQERTHPRRNHHERRHRHEQMGRGAHRSSRPGPATLRRCRSAETMSRHRSPRRVARSEHPSPHRPPPSWTSPQRAPPWRRGAAPRPLPAGGWAAPYSAALVGSRAQSPGQPRRHHPHRPCDCRDA